MRRDTPSASPWRASLHALRRAPALLVPVLLAGLVLPLADLIPATPNPYDFEHLRPIDTRTQAVCLSTTLVGVLVGWVAAMLNVHDRRAGRPLVMPPSFYGFESLPAHRAAIASAVAFTVAAGGLMAADFALGLSLWLATMVAIQCATVALFVPVVVHSRRSKAVAALALLVVAGTSLVSALGMPLKFSTALVPSFWIGHTLCADQIGVYRGMAAFVGVCLNLLPLAMAIGLNLADRDAERAGVTAA